MTAETAIELAQRAFALKKYEESVDHYATALELVYVTLIITMIQQTFFD